MKKDNKTVDEIAEHIAERYKNYGQVETLEDRLEKKVAEYLQKVGSVDRKDCVEHDFREGAKFALRICREAVKKEREKVLSELDGFADLIGGNTGKDLTEKDHIKLDVLIKAMEAIKGESK